MPEDHSTEGYLLRRFMAQLYKENDVTPCGGCMHHRYEQFCEKYQRPPYWFMEDDWPTQRCVRDEGWNE